MPRHTYTVHVRIVSSRTAFRPSTYEGRITSSKDVAVAVVRGRSSWSEAARDALALADLRGMSISNRAVIERAISERALER